MWRQLLFAYDPETAPPAPPSSVVIDPLALRMSDQVGLDCGMTARRRSRLSDTAMRLGALPARYRSLVGRLGFIAGTHGFVCLVGYKLAERLLGLEVLYLVQKEVTRVELPAHSFPLSFGEASGTDCVSIGRLNPDRPASFIEGRLRVGERCYVARSSSGELCAYLWCAPGDRVVRYRSWTVPLAKSDVYIRDVLTLPEYRGRGVAPRLLAWVGDSLASQCVTRMSAIIRSWNLSSLAAFKSAGFHLEEKAFVFALPLVNREMTLARKTRHS